MRSLVFVVTTSLWEPPQQTWTPSYSQRWVSLLCTYTVLRPASSCTKPGMDVWLGDDVGISYHSTDLDDASAPSATDCYKDVPTRTPVVFKHLLHYLTPPPGIFHCYIIYLLLLPPTLQHSKPPLPLSNHT
ncbi:hypothetical protein BR93DRAFT_466767 [Coniochaeta sp. PMI_546]|nr:hypothetical protein BR93DRAFT_466767 [Coniochaeta sp. PMI_546]